MLRKLCVGFNWDASCLVFFVYRWHFCSRVILQLLNFLKGKHSHNFDDCCFSQIPYVKICGVHFLQLHCPVSIPLTHKFSLVLLKRKALSNLTQLCLEDLPTFGGSLHRLRFDFLFLNRLWVVWSLRFPDVNNRCRLLDHQKEYVSRHQGLTESSSMLADRKELRHLQRLRSWMLCPCCSAEIT